MPSTILIAGPTGPIGQFLVRELTARHQAVRVLVRELSRPVPMPNGPLVHHVETPVLSVSVLDAMVADISHLVLLSAPAPDQVLWNGALIEAAERTGRPIHLVPVLAMGAISRDPALQFAHWHAATMAQIRSTDLPMTEIRPQLLMQSLLRTTASIQTDNLVFGAYGRSRLPQVDAADVAAAIATVLCTDHHDGQSYVLTGPQSFSYDDLAAVLSSTLGRNIRYVDMPAEAFHEHLLGNGVSPWVADNLAALGRLFQTHRTWPVSPSIAELTGRPAHPLHRFVREHASAFRSSHTPVPVHDMPVPTPFLL